MSDGHGDYVRRRCTCGDPGSAGCVLHGLTAAGPQPARSAVEVAALTDVLFPGNRKEYPVFTGLLMYFPNACAAVARCSYVMNEQHNPGEPMHWAQEKSIGTGDETVRHLMDSAAGTPPQVVSGHEVEHAANHAWRAMEYLERLILKRRG